MGIFGMTSTDPLLIGNEFFVNLNDKRLSIFGYSYNIADYKHRIIFEDILDSNDKSKDMKNWCIDNKIKDFDFLIIRINEKQNVIFLFENEDEFVLFKMTWG